MAKGYWIATYRSVSDPDKLAAYGKIAGPVLQAAGGRFLARGGEVIAFEAGQEERTVLIEFPSRQAAVDAYHSDEYQHALEVFDGAAVRDIRLVEGLD